MPKYMNESRPSQGGLSGTEIMTIERSDERANRQDEEICRRTLRTLHYMPAAMDNILQEEQPLKTTEESSLILSTLSSPLKLSSTDQQSRLLKDRLAVTSGDFHPESLRILVAPTSFKEALGPEAVAVALEEGLRRVVDEDTATIVKLPLHDGGEGFCKALVAHYGGEMREVVVTGPVGEPVASYFGLVGEGKNIAVLDMAAAAGLSLVPRTQRDPTRTTTYGVGELIRVALEAGVTKILVGCGDSGTSDGGAGMLQALGARLLDEGGEELPWASGGKDLSKIAMIVMDDIHPALRSNGSGGRVQIEAICNTKNVLCGDRGVARVYGPQKGATEGQVDALCYGLERWAKAVSSVLQEDISTMPGSGASGGLGSGLLVLGAELRSRREAIDELFCIGQVLDQRWDIVFTAEGGLDLQSAQGKMTVEVARRFRSRSTQVIVLAGTIGDGADALYEEGIDAFASIPKGPISLMQAIRETESLLRDAAERTMRMISTGMAMRPLKTCRSDNSSIER